MYKITPLFIATFLLLSGCVSGTISTAAYENLPAKYHFTIITKDNISLTNRNLSAYIEKKMIGLGHIKATPPETANIAVYYSYSIGSGRTHVSSDKDLTIESNTTYPRFFQIILVDMKKSKNMKTPKIIWQGEVRSRGSSDNISELGEIFINALFENYGKTIKSKKFSEVMDL